LCLAAYLLGGAKILPALLALAACAEGSHAVRADSSPSAFALILHHESGLASGIPREAHQPPAHRHGFTSKLICTLASGDSFDPDHVLQLANGFVSEPASSELSVCFAPDYPELAPRLALDEITALSAEPPPVETHPPPHLSGHLFALRVTVLLI